MTIAPEPRRVTAHPLSTSSAAGEASPAVRRFDELRPARRTMRESAEPANPSPEAVPRLAREPRPEDIRAEQRHIAMISRLVGQAAFETMAGLRPVHQLARWLDPATFEKVSDRVELTKAAIPSAERRLYRNTAVRRTRLCRVGEGIYEASVVVSDRTRVRAAALRIERRRGQWKVSALEIG